MVLVVEVEVEELEESLEEERAASRAWEKPRAECTN